MLALLLTTFLAVEAPSEAQTSAQPAPIQLDQTFGVKNGRYWLRLGTGAQAAFLAGLADGWFLGLTTQPAVLGEHLSAFRSGNAGPVSWADLAHFASSVYSDRENINLPIAWVAAAGLAVFRGETTRESVLPVLRRYVSLHLGRDGPLPDFPINEIRKSGGK